MACTWLFCVLAVLGLQPKLTTFIAWLSSNFLQLVLLPIIMVGQNLKDRAHHEHHKSLHRRLDNIEKGVN